jgi:hypothetical protein
LATKVIDQWRAAKARGALHCAMSEITVVWFWPENTPQIVARLPFFGTHWPRPTAVAQNEQPFVLMQLRHELKCSVQGSAQRTEAKNNTKMNNIA